MRKAQILLPLLTAFPIYAGQSVTWLQQYIAIDTVNPRAMNSGESPSWQIFLKKQISYSKRPNLLPAGETSGHVLRGGNQPALILLHHIDVVPVDRKYWDMAPLSGEIRGDCIYGRSAIDIKGLGIPQLSSFLALRDSSEKLNRNVIFRATADEEAGGHYSAGWLLENRPEIFKETGYLVNEGGSTTLLDEIMAFNIEVTQQLPL
jgi:acetylornithine deacetylase/succinyl-diaminopimelate desuccinylase-like protein